MKCLVTAGSSREMIDKVRDWGNTFTGNTGYAIAKALAEVAQVDLLTSNRQHVHEIAKSEVHAITATPFTSHAELKGSLAALMGREEYDAVFMTAAVADYKPAHVFSVISRDKDSGETHNHHLKRERWIVEDVQAAKVKSDHEIIAVLGERTEKLVDLFRSEWNYSGLLVKFKLEVGISPEALVAIAQASRLRSGADFIVANTLEMVEGPEAGAFLLGEDHKEWVERGCLPDRLMKLVLSRAA